MSAQIEGCTTHIQGRQAQNHSRRVRPDSRAGSCNRYASSIARSLASLVTMSDESFTSAGNDSSRGCRGAPGAGAGWPGRGELQQEQGSCETVAVCGWATATCVARASCFTCVPARFSLRSADRDLWRRQHGGVLSSRAADVDARAAVAAVAGSPGFTPRQQPQQGPPVARQHDWHWPTRYEPGNTPVTAMQAASKSRAIRVCRRFASTLIRTPNLRAKNTEIAQLLGDPAMSRAHRMALRSVTPTAKLSYSAKSCKLNLGD